MAQQSILPKSIDPTKQLVNQEPPVWVQALALLANAPGAGWLGQDLSYINKGYALGELRTARDAARLGYQAQQGQQNPFQLAQAPETVQAKSGPFGLFGTKERAPTEQEKAIIQAGAMTAQIQQLKILKEGAAYLKTLKEMQDAKYQHLGQIFKDFGVGALEAQIGMLPPDQQEQLQPLLAGAREKDIEKKKKKAAEEKAAGEEETLRLGRIREMGRKEAGILSPAEQREQERAFRGGEKQAIGEQYASFIMDARKARNEIDKLLGDPDKLKDAEKNNPGITTALQQRRNLLQAAINQAAQRRAEAKAILSLPAVDTQKKRVPTLPKGAYRLLEPVGAGKTSGINLTGAKEATGDRPAPQPSSLTNLMTSITHPSFPYVTAGPAAYEPYKEPVAPQPGVDVTRDPVMEGLRSMIQWLSVPPEYQPGGLTPAAPMTPRE